MAYGLPVEKGGTKLIPAKLNPKRTTYICRLSQEPAATDKEGSGESSCFIKTVPTWRSCLPNPFPECLAWHGSSSIYERDQGLFLFYSRVPRKHKAGATSSQSGAVKSHWHGTGSFAHPYEGAESESQPPALRGAQ